MRIVILTRIHFRAQYSQLVLKKTCAQASSPAVRTSAGGPGRGGSRLLYKYIQYDNTRLGTGENHPLPTDPDKSDAGHRPPKSTCQAAGLDARSADRAQKWRPFPATLAKRQNATRHPSHRGPPPGQSWKPAGGALERWWCERSLLNTLLRQSYPNASFLLTKESLQCFICLTISSVACVRKNGRLVNEAPSAATSHEPWWTTRLRPAGHCAAAMPQPRPAGDSW